MLPGSLVGKYRLIRPIGRGAMGEVWAATNIDTDGEVALKLITSPDPELRRRLLREGRAIGRLEHPNIVQIFDRGETQAGEPFLVMQLLQGETLGDRLRRVRALPPPVAAGIALDVARALRLAHEKQIVHRDLKPANVFLHREPDNDDDVVKVVDFGVSKLSVENEGVVTVMGDLLGSPAYMSPEQIRGGGVDGRTDIWALGVLLFEMLTGQRPFVGPGVSVLQMIVSRPAPRVETLVPTLDPALCAVVAGCLERDPARRVASAAELIGLLRPLVMRGRSATVEEPARERFASFPDAPPAPRVERARESDVATVFRPWVAPPAPGTGTVLLAGAPQPAAQPDPPSVDESERPTAEIIRASPRAPEAPPPFAPSPAAERRPDLLATVSIEPNRLPRSAAEKPGVRTEILDPRDPALADARARALQADPRTSTQILDPRVIPASPRWQPSPGPPETGFRSPFTSPPVAPLAPVAASPGLGRSRLLPLGVGLALCAALAILTIAFFTLQHERAPAAVPSASASAPAPSDPAPIAPAPNDSSDAGPIAPEPVESASGDPLPTPETAEEDPDAGPSTTAPWGKTGPGTLNINSIPPSRVVLDGKPLGHTPKVGVSVPAGAHTVMFVHPELGKKSVTVRVRPGEMKVAAVRF